MEKGLLMVGKCKSHCFNYIKGLKGMKYSTHAWCKNCDSYFTIPAPNRCTCCNNILRTHSRFSVTKKNEIKVRHG